MLAVGTTKFINGFLLKPLEPVNGVDTLMSLYTSGASSLILAKEEPDELTIANLLDSNNFKASSHEPQFVLGRTPLSVNALYCSSNATVLSVLKAAFLPSLDKMSMFSDTNMLNNPSGKNRYAPVLL